MEPHAHTSENASPSSDARGGDRAFRLLVSGSRDWTDDAAIEAALRGCGCEAERHVVVLHGAARGADRLADRAARLLGYAVERFPAEWSVHHPDWCPGDWCERRSYCVGAGPRRNQQMLDHEPDAVLAFKDGFDFTLSKGGTEDMVKRASEAGVPTKVGSHDADPLGIALGLTWRIVEASHVG